MAGNRLIVWGGFTFIDGHKQKKTIVATCTKKQAAKILDYSMYSFNKYFSATGNAVQIQVATARPGAVFVEDVEYSADWKRVKPKR